MVNFYPSLFDLRCRILASVFQERAVRSAFLYLLFYILTQKYTRSIALWCDQITLRIRRTCYALRRHPILTGCGIAELVTDAVLVNKLDTASSACWNFAVVLKGLSICIPLSSTDILNLFPVPVEVHLPYNFYRTLENLPVTKTFYRQQLILWAWRTGDRYRLAPEHPSTAN